MKGLKWQDVGRAVIAELIALAMVALGAFLLSKLLETDVSAVLWVWVAVSTVASFVLAPAWRRQRANARRISTELASIEKQLAESDRVALVSEQDADEYRRRALVAEQRAVEAERRAQDLQEHADNCELEAREAHSAYKNLERWEELSVTGLADFWQRLEGSEQHPREKLDDIGGSLDFMGHGGSKWTRERAKFKSMLDQLLNDGGSARMLLLNPDCEISREKSRRRFDGDDRKLPSKIVKSLLVLHEFQANHNNLDVRLYSHVPHFRLTILARDTVIVGHYREGEGDSARTPLLAWDSKAKWSFFTPFRGYFEHEWALADEVDWTQIQALGEKLQGGPR